MFFSESKLHFRHNTGGRRLVWGSQV